MTGKPAHQPRDIVTLYSRLAPLYGFWTWMTESKSLSVALARAVVRDGEAVLEIGVGTGLVFRGLLLRNPHGRNVGIDVSEEMLRRTRQKAEKTGVPFVLGVGDARTLVFSGDSFDVVLSNNMLGLLPPPDVPRALHEMRRVLRPGGRVVLATMSRPVRGIPHVVYEAGAIRLGGWRDVRLAPLVQSAGFVGLQVRFVQQLGIPTEILEARKPSTDCVSGAMEAGTGPRAR